MLTVNVYRGRSEVGTVLRDAANSVIRTEIAVGPASLFELSGNSGPKYIDINAGTIIENTGCIGDLFMKLCVASVPDEEVQEVPGRRQNHLGIKNESPDIPFALR